MILSEADTSRKFIIAKLQAVGWDNDPHSITEQRSITAGRIIAGEECRTGDIGRIVTL